MHFFAPPSTADRQQFFLQLHSRKDRPFSLSKRENQQVRKNKAPAFFLYSTPQFFPLSWFGSMAMFLKYIWAPHHFLLFQLMCIVIIIINISILTTTTTTVFLLVVLLFRFLFLPFSLLLFFARLTFFCWLEPH